ncbi:MAG: TspO/MBR family protein [Actinomycetales bacterium]
MEFRTAAAIIGVAIVFIYAIGSGIWVNSSPGWYASLNRPSWQPPSFIFGLIWPYNFVVLGIAAVRISNTLTRTQVIVWLTAFAISVSFALSWAYNFYVPHQLQIAAISLTLTALLTLPITYLTFKASVAMGIALIPYQLWVAIAASLAFGYSIKN